MTDLFWTSFGPDVFGSYLQSIREFGFGKLEISKQRQRVRRGEAWLENIEIHPGFLPAQRTGCSVGSRGCTRVSEHHIWMKAAWPPFCKISKTQQLYPSQASSPGGAESDANSVRKRPSLWDQTTRVWNPRFFLTSWVTEPSGCPLKMETVTLASQDWCED